MSASLATPDRPRLLDALEERPFDLVVVGGGITGAGILREAALRGLSAALLEAEDFASGTSSRSSKLIHGGLRYLALGDVALVRETALERKRVFALAPHLAERCWMVVPARSWAGLLKFRAGIGTYEKLGAVEAADRHFHWNAEELAREEPALRSEVWRFACVYREYLTEDARLVLANLRAAARGGALAANHARVEGFLEEQGRAVGVVARCRLSGRELRVRARCVVNAAGPWIEALRRLEDPTAPSVLHLSKGVHVSLPAERLPVRHIVIVNTSDRRSMFVIPRGEVVYVGTTDTSYGRGAEVWPEIERGDVEYVLEPLSRYFDVPKPSAEDVVAAWGGIRPLIAQPGKPPTEISRRDEIWIGPKGVVTIAGGKLTGYRKMAEDVMERVESVLGAPLPPPRQADEPLPGGDFDGDLEALAARLSTQMSVDAAVAARLVRLYGTEAGEVVRRGAAPLLPGSNVLQGEVAWAVAEEAAATLEDLIYRRTRVALYEPRAREALLGPAAARLGALLGWDAARVEREIAHTRSRLEQDLGFARAARSA
jgi:glycerol-3-phosphate dehydrogenase